MGYNSAIDYGLVEHDRFHRIVTLHHSSIQFRYKIYSYLTVATFIALLLSLFFVFNHISGSYPLHFQMGLVLAASSTAFFIDFFLLKVMRFTPEEESYISELPHKLLVSDLYSSEKRFYSKSQPNGFIPDQLFMNPDAEIIICDTKTRKKFKVYPSDIEQITRYSRELAVLEQRPIAKTAYIRCVTPQGTKFLPIKIRSHR